MLLQIMGDGTLAYDGTPPQYFMLTLLLILSVIVLIFISGKARKAVKKRFGSSQKRMEELKFEAELMDKYSTITPELIKNAEPGELLMGAALNIQKELEKNADINTAFSSLPSEKQHIYALYYFLEDSKDKLSSFFKNNGKPLTAAVLDAFKTYGNDDIYNIVKTEYGMFDEENEEMSIDYEVINKADKGFSQKFNKKDLALKLKNAGIYNISMDL
ncbi:MAG: hypothetical protein FWF08_07505 [Oscillospiraceae bacterium]|nr:hypothetical protein [Oscillospiraceae bacterium]